MRLSIAVRRSVKGSVVRLVRLAALVALLGLITFAVSMFYPRPLVVIFSMSVGHVIGALAVALYLLAVVLDTVQSEDAKRGEALSIAPKGAVSAGSPSDTSDDDVGADDDEQQRPGAG